MLVYDKTKCFGGNRELEATLKRRMVEHREADDYIRGAYYTLANFSITTHVNTERKWRGCAVGCAIHEVGQAEITFNADDDRAYTTYHERFVEMFRLPKAFVNLIDELFENVSLEKAPDFAAEVVQGLSHKMDRRVLAGLCMAHENRIHTDADINDVADEVVEAIGRLGRASQMNTRYFI